MSVNGIETPRVLDEPNEDGETSNTRAGPHYLLKGGLATGVIGAILLLLDSSAAGLSSSTTKAVKKVLQGSVNLIEPKVLMRKLTGIKSVADPGLNSAKPALESLDSNTYSKAETLSKGNNWYRIPGWMAGEWFVEEQTQIYSHNLQTGVQNQESKLFATRYVELWGELSDKDGNIWKFERLPEATMIDLGEITEVHNVQKVEVIEISKERVKLRSRAIVSQIDKKTNAVLRTNVVESITEYMPLSKKVLKVQSMLTKLDDHGLPIETCKRNWLASRTKSFTPTFVSQTRQLMPLFCEFLSYKGMAYLIPDGKLNL